MSGPLPSVLRPVTTPLSWGYQAVIGMRNRRLDNPANVLRVNVPVISVGNITTGGTGKTPLVMWIVDRLREAGHQPVIAMRGYGARPGELSDEEAEYMQRFADVPVVVNPDRHEGLSSLLRSHAEIDCAVLDDGFQHRRLHRDLDLVVIDTTRATLRDRVLPAGNLREPLRELRRADHVIMTRASTVDAALAEAVEHHHGRAPLAWADHHWSWIDVYEPGAEQPHVAEPTILAGRSVVTMLGVGNPSAVRRNLSAAGATVLRDIPVRDHQHYDRHGVEMLSRWFRDNGADALITTGKDWVKLAGLMNPDSWVVPVWVPRVELTFIAGEESLRNAVIGASKQGGG